jgi:fatty-acyl-CoA synthase
VAVNRDAPARPGALGRAGPEVRIVDEEGRERPRARFSPAGRLLNASECVGEIVNTAGAGPFEGYYNNPEATARATRFGWYWSGDLGYLDEDGYLYFAGRTADWLRVDGENFAAAPIEEALRRHPDVVLAAVYGVPDPQAGDAVMAGLVLAEGATFDGAGFAAWLDAQADLGPKWRPRFVRILTEVPTTGTFKVVKRTLVHEKWRRDRCRGDAVWVRDRGAGAFRPFTEADEARLADEFAAAGRLADWDL